MSLGWDGASPRDWGDSRGASFACSKLAQSSFHSAQGKVAALGVALPSRVTQVAINGARLQFPGMTCWREGDSVSFRLLWRGGQSFRSFGMRAHHLLLCGKAAALGLDRVAGSVTLSPSLVSPLPSGDSKRQGLWPVL